MEKNNKPETTIRVGNGVKATVWKNETEKAVFYSVTISRTYKRDDNFQDSSSFNRDDLLFVAKAAERAHNYLLDKSND